jgi:hypothetical protein
LDTHDPAARAAALRRIGPPAIAVAIVAGVDVLLCVAGLLWNLVGLAGTPLLQGPDGERAIWFLSGAYGVAMSLFCLGVSAFVLWAALRMRELASYPLALAACVISVVPCLSPCCLLGIPFGIWGLIVLHDREVRPFFPS